MQGRGAAGYMQFPTCFSNHETFIPTFVLFFALIPAYHHFSRRWNAESKRVEWMSEWISEESGEWVSQWVSECRDPNHSVFTGEWMPSLAWLHSRYRRRNAPVRRLYNLGAAGSGGVCVADAMNDWLADCVTDSRMNYWLTVWLTMSEWLAGWLYGE